MTSKAICEALRVTIFSVSGECITHTHSENISGRKTALANHTQLKKNPILL